jgi:hypothetical protein
MNRTQLTEAQLQMLISRVQLAIETLKSNRPQQAVFHLEQGLDDIARSNEKFLNQKAIQPK